MGKKKLQIVLIALLLFGVWGQGGLATTKSFNDVGDSFWAKSEIDFLTGRQMINGYSNGNFGINDPITRAEAAVMMSRYLGWTVSGQEDVGYPDLSTSHWAYAEIATMKQLGFFAPVGLYEPDKRVTRAEMADMLVKTFDLQSASGSKFTDLERGYWAYHPIQILAANRISTGYNDGTFRPEAEVSRAEFAVFMARAMDESFRPSVPKSREGVQTIYDIEIGDKYYQLTAPLMLTSTWMVPGELFEKLGYQVEVDAAERVYITTNEGTQIELAENQPQVWVGDVLVDMTKAVDQIEGQIYIEGMPILRALEKPLVYYPEDRLIRLESPRITVADIKRNAPETIVQVLHEELPYWQWSKRDHDYLEKLRLQGYEGQREMLFQEMQQLTEAFYTYEGQKDVIRGLNYFSDHLTGKLDAVSRGIEARYMLLYQPSAYSYPGVGLSGSTGIWSNSGLTFDYLVADYMYELYAERRETIIKTIESLPDINLDPFAGLNIHGVPFNIKEHAPDGTSSSWSGKASGSHSMLVSNSTVQTFIHEFGHNWDAIYGNEDDYLALRGKTGYTPHVDEWAHRVHENFAEDFVYAFLPEQYPKIHKAEFGEPTSDETLAFRDWVKQQEQAAGEVGPNFMTLDGASVVPDVLLLPSGELHVQGVAEHTVYGVLVDLSNGNQQDLEIASNGVPFDQVIQLPRPGVYKLTLGKYQTTVVYR